MLRNQLTIFILLVCVQSASAQYYKVSGKILTTKLEPLALVSIQLKGDRTGQVTKEDGYYEFQLEEGNYEIIVSMIGYRSQVISLAVTGDYTRNIIMETDDKDLSEVVVRGKVKDRSEEIIRQVIRHKEEILAAAGPYSCDVYIRAMQEDSVAPKKKKKKAIADSLLKKNPNLIWERMSMAEISLLYEQESANRYREERTGVVKRGNAESLFYLSVTEADFNLYNNLLRAPALSQVPFLSPISYSGLAAYRFKMISIRQVGNHKHYTISIKPRQLSNVTVEGEITIMDSAWVILSAKYTLPRFHVPEYDRFEVEQQYSLVNDSAWMITRQHFRYHSATGKGKLSGETIATYRSFKLNKVFPRKHFGVEVSATAQEAYERDSSFWGKTRTEPLTLKELQFIRYKDSLYEVTHSKFYLDSIDAITNKVTWKKIAFTGQSLFNREKERLWVLPAVLTLFQPFQLGGLRINPAVFYTKSFPSKKDISVFANISYGIRNKDLNGGVRIIRLYNPFNRGFYRLEANRDFQYIFSGDAWINMIQRSNLYLNNAVGVGHGVELFNGFFLYSDLDVAFRRSVSNYKTNDRIDSLFGDLLDNNQAVAFEPYDAVYGKIRLQYTPGQKYIREPKQKVILGSRWPTFYTLWRKGIPGIMNSKVDFDYLEFGMEQELKLGITGITKYNIKTGSFLNKKDLRLVDYQFQRRGDPFLFMNPHEAFQSLDSTFATFRRFYQGHLVHEFNGAILNKVPLLKKLQLREIAGAGFLIAKERDLRYAEIFTGVERVFKLWFNPLVKFKLGVYVIGSVANQFKNPVQFKIGITTWDRRSNKWF